MIGITQNPRPRSGVLFAVRGKIAVGISDFAVLEVFLLFRRKLYAFVIRQGVLDILVFLCYVVINELDFCGKATKVIRCTYRIKFIFLYIDLCYYPYTSMIEP